MMQIHTRNGVRKARLGSHERKTLIRAIDIVNDLTFVDVTLSELADSLNGLKQRIGEDGTFSEFHGTPEE